MGNHHSPTLSIIYHVHHPLVKYTTCWNPRDSKDRLPSGDEISQKILDLAKPSLREGTVDRAHWAGVRLVAA